MQRGPGKTDRGATFPKQFQEYIARLASSLLSGTRAMHHLLIAFSIKPKRSVWQNPDQGRTIRLFGYTLKLSYHMIIAMLNYGCSGIEIYFVAVEFL